MLTDTVREALQMIADPDLASSTWAEVQASQRLDPNEDADGESFCAVMRSCWAYAKMARLILQGTEEALREFIEHVDPQRLIRGPKKA
jgi:hypothetical protein